jgi:hypothetical protein
VSVVLDTTKIFMALRIIPIPTLDTKSGFLEKRSHLFLRSKCFVFFSVVVGSSS